MAETERTMVSPDEESFGNESNGLSRMGGVRNFSLVQYSFSRSFENQAHNRKKAYPLCSYFACSRSKSLNLVGLMVLKPARSLDAHRKHFANENAEPQPRENAIVRVIVSDASLIGCQMLRDALMRNRPEFNVVFSGSTVHELLTAAHTLDADVAVISLTLADGHTAGLDVVQQITANSMRPRVIVLVDAPEPDVIVKAFRSGARGVFSRTNSTVDLQKAIEAVHDGQVWVGSTELEYILDALAVSPTKAPQTIGNSDRALSQREEQIVTLVASGLSKGEIAEQLNISVHTVKNYLFRIYDKLGVSNRVELILFAHSTRERERGILP